MSARGNQWAAGIAGAFAILLAVVMSLAIGCSQQAAPPPRGPVVGTYSDPTYTTPFQIHQVPSGGTTQLVSLGSGGTLGFDAGSTVDLSAAAVTMPAATTNSATTATYTASSGSVTAVSSGTLTMTEPSTGSFKRVVLSATALTTSGASTLVWPTAFTQTPAVLAMSSGTNGKTYSLTTAGTGAVLTPSATGATLSQSNSAASGYFILEGN